MEVITGVARRRRFTTEQKLSVVNETLQPGMSISLLPVAIATLLKRERRSAGTHRSGVHQARDFGGEFPISGAGLGTSLPAFACCSFNQIGMGYSEGLCDPLHGVSSGSCDRDSKVGFLLVQDPEPL